MRSNAAFVMIFACPLALDSQTRIPEQTPIVTRSIHVRVVTSDSLPSIDLLLASASTHVVKTRTVPPNESIEFPLLLPGRYVVRASATKQGGAGVACQIIDVSEGDATVDLPLATGGRLHGRVVDEAGETLTIKDLHVIAALADGSTDLDPQGRDSALVNETGRFTIDGLCGERILRIRGLPSGWQLREVQRSGAVVPALTVDPGADVADVTVVVRPVR